MFHPRRLALAFAASVALHLALGLWPAEEGRRIGISAPLLARLEPRPESSPPPAKAPPSKKRAKAAAPQVAAPGAGAHGRARLPSTIALPAGAEASEELEAEKLNARQRTVPRSEWLLSPAVPLEPIEPRYPPEALAQGIRGHVLLEAIIGTNGRAQEIILIEDNGLPQLAQAAAEAVRRTRFKPARGAQGATASRIALRVEFTYE